MSGKIEKINIAPDYLDFVSKDFKISRKIKIAVGGEESTAKLYLPELFRRLGVAESDSDFDFKISFDCDGDRLLVFDENGIQIRGDIVAGIIGSIFLQRGDRMISTVVSTKSVDEILREKGVDIFRSSVGSLRIKKAMKEKGAVFGAEISGHFYFRIFHYAESAFFSLRKILEALDKNPDLKISDLARRFQKYFHSGEINLPFVSSVKWNGILQKVKKDYKDGRQNFEDGISVEYSDPASGGTGWWFNLRPSNTEPIIRLVVEAETKELMEQKTKELFELLNF